MSFVLIDVIWFMIFHYL